MAARATGIAISCGVVGPWLLPPVQHRQTGQRYADQSSRTVTHPRVRCSFTLHCMGSDMQHGRTRASPPSRERASERRDVAMRSCATGRSTSCVSASQHGHARCVHGRRRSRAAPTTTRQTTFALRGRRAVASPSSQRHGHVVLDARPSTLLANTDLSRFLFIRCMHATQCPKRVRACLVYTRHCPHHDPVSSECMRARVDNQFDRKV